MFDWISDWILRRRGARNRERRQSECGFRDRSGAVSPLFRRWRHGRVELGPGTMLVHPWVPLGLRIPRPFTAPIALVVTGVERDIRQIKGLEMTWASGMVHHLKTPEGDVEFVVAHTDLDWLLQIVLPEPTQRER